MKNKYYFIKGRLNEIGKTQTEFAESISITQQKLNVTLNHPELREFQAGEIVLAADFLGYELRDFAMYVSGFMTDIPRDTIHKDDSRQDLIIKLTREEEVDMIVTIMKTINEILFENNLELSIEGKATIFAHLYKMQCKDPARIKEAVSLLRLANSELFTKSTR